ncbi:unnamed protein product [Bursaphelenchus xylophilus]|uniref:(pine wood nematode) hypothetical protein n=1 Tax=Bursaphelenchus xylophilus TaxID=6326 RepID=A0A811K0V4_BURXY|nr:unnamed protein product [Bursaphelenchus xylophilus]CAG9084636.1 unnamed protein product [Bursaphelenchus xylophilus]
MSQTPYLGSKISLISKLDIRYEGILYTVDSNESTIALAKVRSFGTEDRHTDHPVKARDEVYEFIIFKASDIKDLVVCEAAKEESNLGGLDYDPAIVSVQAAPAASENSKPSSSSAIKPRHKLESEVPSGLPAQSSRPRANETGRYNQKIGSGSHRPSYNPRGNGFHRFNKNVTPKEKLKFDSDYDFERANERFKAQMDSLTADMGNKIVFDADVEERKEKENTVELSPCYDKTTSFFDNISCESQEKADGKNKRPDWRKERQTNQETFGQYAVRNYNNRPGGYRGGYRGGRYPNNNHNQRRGGSRNPANPVQTKRSDV